MLSHNKFCTCLDVSTIIKYSIIYHNKFNLKISNDELKILIDV